MERRESLLGRMRPPKNDQAAATRPPPDVTTHSFTRCVRALPHQMRHNSGGLKPWIPYFLGAAPPDAGVVPFP
jgi:hypothetical protein